MNVTETTRRFLEFFGDRGQMLGSWSLGDYEGEQSLRWGCQLTVDGLGIGRDRLHATVFSGDEHVGPDIQSLQTWAELGVPVESTTEDNW